MSIDPETAKRLRDVRRAGRELDSYCEGRIREDLLTDRSLQLIVERILEIVGEALRRAELGNPEVPELFPEAREIVGTRYRLIHGYDDINYQLV